jgi:hypothetical protein
MNFIYGKRKLLLEKTACIILFGL